MEIFTIHIEEEISLQKLNNLIVAALEGGSNYWYCFRNEAENKVMNYKRKYIPEIHGERSEFYSTWNEAVLPAVIAGEVLGIHDLEDGDEEGVSPIGHLSIAKIKYGLQKMVKDQRPEIKCLFTNWPDDDWDANTADVIFQYICLGEIIYG